MPASPSHKRTHLTKQLQIFCNIYWMLLAVMRGEESEYRLVDCLCILAYMYHYRLSFSENELKPEDVTCTGRLSQPPDM